MEWINVKDGNPKDCKTGWEYFVCTLEPNGYGGSYVKRTRIMSYDFLDNCWNCNNIIVTHWMVLPKPPKD